MNITPPKKALQFLRWFCREDYLEEIEGDLTEVFQKQCERFPRKAKWKFTWSVIKYFRPEFMKSFKNSYQPQSYSMFKNYFKIGWRNLLKDKGYSFINIGGLAVGMSVAVLIGLWIYDELSFNKYFRNYDRIGHVMAHNGDGTHPSNPIPLSAELRSTFGDDFKHVVMSTWSQEYSIAYQDKKFFQAGTFMQRDAPEMLALEMTHGTRSALKDPNSILISESLAKKLFGDAEPLNRTLRIKNMVDLNVAGVYKDLPHNTEFHNLTFIGSWDFLVSWMSWMKELEERWDDNSYKIYVQLSPQADFDQVSAKIKDLKLKHLNEKNAALKPELFVHPMSRWHLYSKFENRKLVTSDQLEYIWLYGIIGVFVLLLACINFMNLSTAKSEKRAKEVGIRKTMGSVRGQLINQFFSESFLMTALALIVAILIAQLSLPWFNEIAGKEIALLWDNSVFWLAIIAFMSVTAILAGSYPALYLSSLQPVKVLKGVFRAGRFASIPRKILVVFQFAVSVTLILGTIIVFQQIQFAKNRPTGYTRDNLMAVYMITPDLYQRYDLIRTELLRSGVVTSVAASQAPVTEIWSNNSGFEWNGKDPDLESNFVVNYVTPEYGKTIEWKFLQGRDFSEDLVSDSISVVVNKAAIKYMGLKNPIDETVKWNQNQFHIIGVVEDMIMGSPFEAVRPTLFFLNHKNIYTINIKIDAKTNSRDAVNTIAGIFQKHNPSVPFEYKFVDEEYESKFANEERIGNLSLVFAMLAILISCLGLFGLASFVAEQRTKEIGIRKVMGATVSNLWQMLSKDFVVLVVISCFIAIPMGYYFMSSWLQKYVYHTEISIWIFLVTCTSALCITLLTVSFQAVKAALMNPVNSLRSE
jgi:putative ABC transport system permease protein